MTSALPQPYAPLVASGHPDDEPRGEAENGSPCPFCGLPVWYERADARQPMRWVHRDGTPRCNAAIATLRRAMAHLEDGTPAVDSVEEGMVAVFDHYVAISRRDLAQLERYGARQVVDLARRVLVTAGIVVQDPCTGCGGQVDPSDYRSGCPLCPRCLNS